MPIHDWTRVPSGLYHEFHQSWTIRIKDALNAGLMPDGYYALVDQRAEGPEPDVIAVETSRSGRRKAVRSAGAAVLEPPRTKLVQDLEPDSRLYARRANRISIRHMLGDVVAIIEVISPGNKDGKSAFESFVAKMAAFLRAKVHVLIVDLFPPSPRDPQGIHKAILEQFGDQPFKLPAGKPLTLVSYQAFPTMKGYIEPVAVGDVLMEMPLFLTSKEHVRVPLESTYMQTWKVCPKVIKDLIEGRTSLPSRGRRGR
jgi:hypothetical protein